ncbi:MAG: DUF1156 domain-containing protein [Candidatus Aureabacteria bacterium]|nr:DUF1156 domain-containing protein [Candidatus Auribacterota bacterium]
MKRAIEDSFPIVEINKLAVPERNAFKPIYQMHKWFARRSSCVFRAILLGAMKPSGTDIMQEFYKDHTSDPDTNGVSILDTFMGGGTTVIEALRLGCHVTGIDLNPVAWFIVKTEAEPVAVADLEKAFARLSERKTITGKPLKEELLSHYKTACPCCGNEADIIYTFWVKSALCTDPNCGKQVPLFGDYIISQKSPSIKYVADYGCGHCGKTFDLDLDAVSMTGKQDLMVNSGKDSAGEGRANKRWTVYNEHTHEADCPWCNKKNEKINLKLLKNSKKKVPMNVLLCPHCYGVWQYRGNLPETVNCPICKKDYDPNKGNMEDKKFVCPTFGTKDSVINSLRRLPEDELLPVKPYAVEGYCKACDEFGELKESGDLFSRNQDKGHSEGASGDRRIHPASCLLQKFNGKFFKKIEPKDLKRYQDAEKTFEKFKDQIPYPKSSIPEGGNTNQMIKHNYRFWHQMFNPRQLLCLGLLLKAIDEEKDQNLKEMMLSAFFTMIEANNLFTRYNPKGDKSEGVFARHDFQPKLTICESNIFGADKGARAFNNNVSKIIEGKKFNVNPFDRQLISDKLIKVDSSETIAINSNSHLLCQNSAELQSSGIQLVITDPPYAGNVNYSELADFFYVWLRLILKKTYPHFAPEYTPKLEEIVENATRGKSNQDYQDGLTSVWKKCYDVMDNNGLLIFTFHHAEESAWESLLESLCNAGFYLEAVYPIHGEAENSLHLMDKEAISYDLIHVCKKRIEKNEKKKSWAGIRSEIRKKAREEISLIESGRYGQEKLPASDINIVLIGKCLQFYSLHYGNIVDYKDEIVPLKEALRSIKMMVEQFASSTNPLPSELENIDRVSYVYLTCLCDRMEIKSDEVHKATRGLLEPDELIKSGIMRKGRAKRGRTYEVKNPKERTEELEKIFGKKDSEVMQLSLFPVMEEERFDKIPLVDVLHHLMNIAEKDDNLVPWLSKFKIIIPQVRNAFEYLQKKNPTFQEPLKKILQLIEV